VLLHAVKSVRVWWTKAELARTYFEITQDAKLWAIPTFRFLVVDKMHILQILIMVICFSVWTIAFRRSFDQKKFVAHDAQFFERPVEILSWTCVSQAT
jgi:hypothetical protein